MKEKILYFAYGSNMSSQRFMRRIESAKAIEIAYLKDRKVLFNKQGVDGSGKANLIDAPGEVTWGVLYEIENKDLIKLDRIEGGYERTSVQVWRISGEEVSVVSYISKNLTDDPAAYDWYKDLLIKGAREHNLPQEYIDYLEQLPSKNG